MVFNSWMPTYLSRRFGVSLVESGLVVALFPAMGVLSRPAGGWASDGPFDRRRRPVFAVAFGGAVVLAAALWATATVALLVVGLALAGLFIQFPIGVLYQYVQEFVDADVAGTAISLVSVTGWLGSFVGPVALGGLIDVSGEVTVAFAFAAALGLAGLVTTGMTGESAERPTAA
jgi:NNP family nitrate/nitrite transporter-like MFS transporter